MAKRSNRSRRNTSVAPAAQPVAQSVAPAADKNVDFAHEYAYVYFDVRTMLIITVVVLTLGVGLSFIF